MRLHFWLSTIPLQLRSLLRRRRVEADLDEAFGGIEPGDPATFVSVAALLMAAGCIAAWIPARRASRVDPLAALRHE